MRILYLEELVAKKVTYVRSKEVLGINMKMEVKETNNGVDSKWNY